MFFLKAVHALSFGTCTWEQPINVQGNCKETDAWSHGWKVSRIPSKMLPSPCQTLIMICELFLSSLNLTRALIFSTKVKTSTECFAWLPLKIPDKSDAAWEMSTWTLLTIRPAQSPNLIADKLSATSWLEGEQQTIKAVLALPPKESCDVRNVLKLELEEQFCLIRYTTYVPSFAEATRKELLGV